MKYFLISSDFILLNATDNFNITPVSYNGLPSKVIFNCECENELVNDLYLKGFFTYQDKNYDIYYEFYLIIMAECNRCKKTTVIYRVVDEIFLPLMIFLKFLSPDKKFRLDDGGLRVGWSRIFAKALDRNYEEIKKYYWFEFERWTRLIESY